MKITFLGAARTVTGSCYVLEAAGKRFAVDCGMHQGNKDIENRNRDFERYRAEDLDFLLVTHAHIDHTGLLPLMVKEGFKGSIYLTPPTADLLDIMLQDSAHIQEMEAEWENKKRLRHGREPVLPLYGSADATAAVELFKPIEYNSSFEPAPGVTVTYYDAGHILGSAFIEINIKENGKSYCIVFSGDLGRPNQLLVKDPTILERADYLFLESTYGDRDHKSETISREELAEAIAYSFKNNEKVIIPAFAVERSQEIIYTLSILAQEGKLPASMPIYLDSPLAIRATQIFRQHPEYLDEATRKLIEEGKDPLDLPNLKLTISAEQSIAINETKGPAIVISASGMCNAGRIKHHLRHNIWRQGASIVFTGYQGVGTPGRKIVDGAKRIRILGEDVAVAAKVFTIGGFSSHAGQTQILEWISHFTNSAMKVFLVHGEPKAQETLSGLIRDKFGFKIHIPDYLEEIVLEPGMEPAVERYPEKARPKVDWEYIISDTERRLGDFRARVGTVQDKNWVEQTDLRDRMLEVNRMLMELISEV